MSRFIPSLALLVLATVNVFILPLRGQEPAPLPPSTQSTEPASYDDLLARARVYAAEQSWALARESYLAAADVAPSDEDRRWCGLWAVDASWRGAPSRRVTPAVIASSYEPLLAPYEAGSPRDDYWIAVMRSRADAQLATSDWIYRGGERWSDYLIIADHLGEQGATVANASRYRDYLLEFAEVALLKRVQPMMPAQMEDVLFHLRRGIELDGAPEHRAALAIQAGLFASGHNLGLERVAPYYEKAVQLAEGTPIAETVKAHLFLWQAKTGQLKPDEQGYPNIPLWVNQLRSLVDLLILQTPTSLSSEAINELNMIQREWEQSRFEWTVQGIYRPDQPLRYAIRSAFAQTARFELYRLSPPAWHEMASQRTRPDTQPVIPESATPVHAWTLDLASAPDHVWKVRVEDFESPLSPGFYVVHARIDDARQEVRRFIVSAAAVTIVHRDESRGELHFMDNLAGTPIAHGDVEGWHFTHLPDANASVTEFKTQTDDQGRAIWEHAANQRARHDVILTINDQPVWLTNPIGFYNLHHRKNQEIDLFVERELFRPGETVHWKLIARDWLDGRFALPEGTLTLHATLEDEPLHEPLEIRWNEAGTAHGSLVVPQHARPGEAMLSLRKGTENVADLSFFRVDNFRPPAGFVALELDGPPEALRSGGVASVRIRANYYSGGAIPNARVQLFLHSHQLRSSVGGTHSSSDQTGVWSTRMMKQGLKATTNGEGIADFRIELPSYLPSPLDLDASYVVLADGMPELRGTASIHVTASGLGVEMEGPIAPQWAAPGEQLTFRVRAIDGLGHPTHAPVAADLVEQRWREAWLDPSGNVVAEDAIHEARREFQRLPRQDLPAPWKKLYGQVTEHTVASGNFLEPDADGWMTVRVSAPHKGVFRVNFKSNFGEVALRTKGSYRGSLDTLLVYAADEATDRLFLPPERSLLIGRGQNTLSYLVIVPEGTTRAILVLSGERESHSHIVEPKGRVAVVAIENPPRHAGRINARIITPQSIYGPLHTTTIPDSARELTVSFQDGNKEERPGFTSSWTVTTHDSQGRPVDAEVAIAVTDEAVNRLLPDNSDTASAFLHHSPALQPDARQSSLWVDHPFATGFDDPRTGLRGFQTKLNLRATFTSRAEGLEQEIQLSPFMVSTEADGFVSALASAQVLMEARSSGLEVSSPPTSTLTVRRHFASSAFWSPTLRTGPDGSARFTFTYPDNLTEWRLAAYAVGMNGSTFGTSRTLSRTSLPFQARLLHPRYLVAGDTSTLSAALINRTASELKAYATIDVSATSHLVLRAPDKTMGKLGVAAADEHRVTWSIGATTPGDAVATLSAKAELHSDAMEIGLPVLEDGFQQHTAASGRLSPQASHTRVAFTLPDTLDRQRTRVTVELTPTRATAMLDALPYLIHYPYGCVEQTVSRFLPALVARRTMTSMGYDWSELDRRILGRESPALARRRSQSAGLGKLDDVIAQGLAKLMEMQQPNGSFGWWDASSEADLWMTAYAALALAYAASEGHEVALSAAGECLEALEAMLENSNATPDQIAFALGISGLIHGESSPDSLRAFFSELYSKRSALSPNGRAGLLLAAKDLGTAEQREILLRNLENGAQRSRNAAFGDTVHWGQSSKYWRAEDSAIEATALTLMALMEIDPHHPDIESAINWLVLNRRSGHWTNTRDTALAVLALGRSLATSPELKPVMEVDVLINGTIVRRVKIDDRSLLSTDLNLALDPALLHSGENAIELRRLSGRGPLYAVAFASSWARGDAVKPAGHLASVARTFVRQASRPTLLGTLHVTPTPLADGETAATGERVSAHVRFELTHALDYVLIEVPKPAGCEPLNPLSGWDARLVRIDSKDESANPAAFENSGRRVYREEHDEKSVFFLHHVPAGTWEVRFELRAIHPGDYRALPVHFEAMYAPEVRANSDARRIRITE